MSLFEEAKLFADKLEYYPYIDVVQGYWYKNDEEIHWLDEEFEHCSSELNCGCLSRQDCVIANTDNGFGETITLFLRKDKQISEDAFYEKYGE